MILHTLSLAMMAAVITNGAIQASSCTFPGAWDGEPALAEGKVKEDSS